ncbi:MAG: hypothetical protein K0S14_3512, partial [Thermomicrobiales bacterium]|nr:hypothetical protein [Thermomicrobiales bacterium]
QHLPIISVPLSNPGLIPGLVQSSCHRIADRDELGHPDPCGLLKGRDVPQPGHATRPDHHSPQRVSHPVPLHLLLSLLQSERHSGQQVTAAERHSGHGGGGQDAAIEEDRSIVHVNLDRHRLPIRPEVIPGQVAAVLD